MLESLKRIIKRKEGQAQSERNKRSDDEPLTYEHYDQLIVQKGYSLFPFKPQEVIRKVHWNYQYRVNQNM